MQWKDTTSYSRGDTKRTPTCWTARAGDIAITVISSHIYHKGTWIIQCDPFYREYELKGIAVDDAAGAQAKALELVRAKLAAAMAALDS